jgi:hypothetical protein
MPRSGSLSSTSDESSSDISSTPCTSPYPSSNDDSQSSTPSSATTTRSSPALLINSNNTNNPEYHVLYVNVNGEYVPVAKTSFIIQAPIQSTNLSISKPTSTNTKPSTSDRKKNYGCTYAGCQKSYFKSSHLKAHIRLHTGKFTFHITTQNDSCLFLFCFYCVCEEKKRLTYITILNYRPFKC